MLRAKKRYRFEPDYAVPPGGALKETMESLNITQKELAVRIGMTVQSLKLIFKGEEPITSEIAGKLELTTDIPARVWSNLEVQYQSQLANIKEREQLDSACKKNSLHRILHRMTGNQKPSHSVQKAI